MAATGNKKGKKKQWKAVELDKVLDSTTLPRKTTSNWADEVDYALQDDTFDFGRKAESKVVLPTAPRAARSSEVDEDKVPREPPFMAYMSNLSYEITEQELADFFQDMKIASFRLPKDEKVGFRGKGFGYVEFEDRVSLINALSLGETTVKGRRINIDVADNSDGGRRFRDSGSRGGDSGPDRTLGDWRSGPKPDGGGSDDRDGYERNRSGPPRRDYGAGGFMSRERDSGSSGAGFGRDGGGGGSFSRDGGGSFNRDRDGGGGFRDRDGGFRDRDGGSFGRDSGSYNRGGAFERRGGEFGGDRGGDRGGSRFGSDRRRDFDRGEQLPPPSADRGSEPKARPKLLLQPRTRPVEEIAKVESGSGGTAAPSAASIFGGAKPVDTAAKEREIEERRAKMREERIPDELLSRSKPPSRDMPRDGPPLSRDVPLSKDGPTSRDLSSRDGPVVETHQDGPLRDTVRDDGPIRDGPPSDAFREEGPTREVPRDKEPKEELKFVEPAPSPKENVWALRQAQQTAPENNGRVSPHGAETRPYNEGGKRGTSLHDDEESRGPPSLSDSNERTEGPPPLKSYETEERTTTFASQRSYNPDDDRRGPPPAWKSGGQRGGGGRGAYDDSDRRKFPSRSFESSDKRGHAYADGEGRRGGYDERRGNQLAYESDRRGPPPHRAYDYADRTGGYEERRGPRDFEEGETRRGLRDDTGESRRGGRMGMGGVRYHDSEPRRGRETMDHRRTDDRGGTRGAWGGRGGVRSDRGAPPRSREPRRDPVDDTGRMPKVQEQSTPNFVASNKFSYLEDSSEAPMD